MIWRADMAAAADRRDDVRAHLRDQLHALLGEPVVRPGLVDDVSAVLATAWQRDFSGAPLPPGSLLLMAARTLWGMGECDAARAVVAGAVGDRADAAVLLELLAGGGPSLAACIGLGAGVLRPVRSAVGAGRPCWRLDLTCLTPTAGHLAELELPGRLQRILGRTAEIWDGADGDGVLHIVRPGSRASSHLGHLLRDEIPDLCRTILERIRAGRGWTHCPRVCRMGV